MTLIVGLKGNNSTYVGGDSFSGNSSYKTVSTVPKVFIKDGMIFGHTSSWRMGQVLRYILNVPRFREDEQTIEEYMVGPFIDAVRRTFDNAGINAKDKGGREEGGYFIVAFRGRVFSVEADYHVNESQFNYTTCGAGDWFADGSLASTEGLDALDRVVTALKAGERHSPLVSGPYIILEMKESGEIMEHTFE